jgi:hypothetical protein
VQGLDKEKDIKFLVYNGDKPLTEDEIQVSTQARDNDQIDRLNKLDDKCSKRYKLQINNGQTIIES